MKIDDSSSNKEISTPEDFNKVNKNKTTSHKWDSIKEYDIPAPRWWLITWLICIFWAFIYWIFYPSWPSSNGNITGSLNWTSKTQLKTEQNKNLILKKDKLDSINQKNFNEITAESELYQFALVGGEALFKENCAACHGSAAQGGKGYPNLNDDDWLWGGKLEDIYQTLLYGIRSGHEKSRQNQMPSFGKDKILNKEQINQLSEYLISLSGNDPDNGKNNTDHSSAVKIFAENCSSCHGKNAEGNQSLGAPRLNDKIWLYGGDKESITYSIYNARAGVMPYWSHRLNDTSIKQLSLYVHSLGGGQ
jgi:cytochrome c oxidase cbb3-type subunit 3